MFKQHSSIVRLVGLETNNEGSFLHVFEHVYHESGGVQGRYKGNLSRTHSL